MGSPDLTSLVHRLSGVARRSLEAAASKCLSRTHYNVELEHWLDAMLEHDGCELVRALRHLDVDFRRFRTDLERALGKLPRGNAKTPTFSRDVVAWLREGFTAASLISSTEPVGTGTLLVALLDRHDLRRTAESLSSIFESISTEQAQRAVKRSPSESGLEQGVVASEGVQEPGTSSPGAAPGGSMIERFTTDLTRLASEGKLSPVIGRDAEIRALEAVLLRQSQNNPLILGEPGVGKTAVVEGFATRVGRGEVAEPLREVRVFALDLGALQAGAGVRGEFEARLKGLMNEVAASPKPIILFIDEIHNLVGAGGESGVGDAANLLKPALARGELRTIGATTWVELKRHLEKDSALLRRFQYIKVDEPSDEKAIDMMRGVAALLERHHGVRIQESAIEASVRLSRRYIADRQLPDKARSLLDTACVQVAMSLKGTPAEVEHARRRVQLAEARLASRRRDARVFAGDTGPADHADSELTQARDALSEIEKHWNMERELMESVLAARSSIEGTQSPASSTPDGIDGKAAEQLGKAREAWREFAGDRKLLQETVDADSIARVIAEWTGVPAARMVSSEIKAVLSLRDRLQTRIIGQPHAMQRIAQNMQAARAGTADPRRPKGVFLLLGTSGVGKTETAKTVADVLYGGEHSMTVINMSEFKSKEDVSLLVGAKPGFVGYGEDGVLSGPVRRKPYSVVLLDEMEKAHREVQDFFYRVFDEGTLRDGVGRDIDFRNTTIFMTSNAASDHIMRLCKDLENPPSADTILEKVWPDLEEVFMPAFLGRTEVIVYHPLGPASLGKIAKLQLARVGDRVRDSYKASFTFEDAVIDRIVSRCTVSQTGARNLDRVITRSIMPELATKLLVRLGDGKPVNRVALRSDPSGDFIVDVE